MKFQIGQYYQHGTGRVISIIGTTHTFFHGSCLLAEEDTGNLIPVGSDEASAQNWHQVSGWARSCYTGNNIPDPSEPTPREANSGSNAERTCAACSLCGDSGTRIIGERDGENFWNRCVPCECRSNPIIPVKANDWAYLNKCARVVEWMGSHGVCWRDATNANSSWRIGDETEWLYGDGHKVIKEVEEHMEFFRANVKGDAPQG